MSIRAVSWALNDAPVDEPVLVLVLVAMAERANDDGTATYQAVATIASKARVSPRTCQRKLRELEDMGLIRRGNQDFTAHLKAGYRPVVYDLAVHLNRGAKLAPLPDGGVPNTTLRGAKSDTSGVPPLADKSSFDSSNNSSVLFEEPARVARSKKKPLTAVPDPFVVTADLEKWFRENITGINYQHETKLFVSYNQMHGKEMRDWPAAWRNWMVKAQAFSQRPVNGGNVVHLPTAQAMQNNGRRLGIDYSTPETDDGYTASNRTR